MKKLMLSITVLLIGISAYADNTAYHSKMKQTLDEMAKCRTAEDFKKVANSFDRIAQKESGEWLPIYFSADIKILLVYLDSAANFEQKDQYLDQAEDLINKMEEMDPDESEIQALKAFMIISRIGLDPVNRGQGMIGDYNAAITKSLELNPENPRAMYMQLSSQVGEAQWFGKSIDSFCPKMKELYENWDSYPVASDLHPQWGKEQLWQIMQPCN